MAHRQKREIAVADNHEEAELHEAEYWQQQDPEARISAMEEINLNLWIMKHGTEEGFHRVHRIISQREG